MFCESRKRVLGVGYPVSWAPCWLRNSITWANLKDKVKIAVGNKNDCLLRKNLIKFFKVFFGSGFVPYTRWGAMLWNMAKIWDCGGKSCDCKENFERKSEIFIYWVRTHWLGAMLWMNRKLGAMLWTNLKYLKSDFRWIIHLRLYSGPWGCRVPGWTKSDIEKYF